MSSILDILPSEIRENLRQSMNMFDDAMDEIDCLIHRYEPIVTKYNDSLENEADKIDFAGKNTQLFSEELRHGIDHVMMALDLSEDNEKLAATISLSKAHFDNIIPDYYKVYAGYFLVVLKEYLIRGEIKNTNKQEELSTLNLKWKSSYVQARKSRATNPHEAIIILKNTFDEIYHTGYLEEAIMHRAKVSNHLGVEWKKKIKDYLFELIMLIVAVILVVLKTIIHFT